MKKLSSVIALCALLMFAVTADTHAVTTTITSINGTGIPDDNWNAETSNGIQLGLRARPAYVAGSYTHDGDGTYNVPTGFAPPPKDSQAAWNYDFSVFNENGLINAEYYLSVDTSSSSAFVPLPIPVALYGDNSYGTISTPNSGGTEGLYAVNAPGNTVLQNSQNIMFLPQSLFGFDPNANGVYDFELYAVAAGAGTAGQRLASVDMTVIVGDAPTSNVPEGGSAAMLLGMGVVALAGLKTRFGK